MASKHHGTQIHLGVGGWNYVPWRKNFYPAGLPQREELAYASRHLTAIEINSTFYRPQKPAVYANWRNQTPDGFVFSLKAPQFVARLAKLANAGKMINAFVFGGLSELGNRLGPISWQFLPARQFDRDDLATFLDLLPAALDGKPLRHVLEVRHASFMCEEYLALARERGVATVFTDSDNHPSFADLTADFVYARLMRSESSIATGYSNAALDAWAERVRSWQSGSEPDDLPRIGKSSGKKGQKHRDVHLYFIGAAKERNPAAAMALIERLAPK